MMQYALESLSNNSPYTQLVAVTILTSLDNDDLQMMKIDISTKDLVSSLARLTKESGLSGVVCSSEEIKLVREACGKTLRSLYLEFVQKVLIKMIKKDNDAKRGNYSRCDHLVIGRPITESKDSRENC